MVRTYDVRYELQGKQFVHTIVFMLFLRTLDSLGFLRCCGSCPFASLLACVLTLTGTGIFCASLYYPLRASMEQINNVFETEYIDYEW